MRLRNVRLNAGGIVGGLLAAGVLMALLVGRSSDSPARIPGAGLGIILGALAGNFLWGQVFGESEQEQEQAKGEGTGNVFRVLREAEALERRGKLHEAVALLEDEVRAGPGAMARDMLQRRLTRLRERLSSQTPPASPDNPA